MMKIIGPFSQILPMRNLPLRGAIKDESLEVINNGGVVVDNQKILDVGSFESLKNNYPNASIEEVESNTVAFPGMIDAHTHICYGGTRAQDFAARNNGKTYLEIAAEGGGIWSTVTNTRKASQEQLSHSMKERLDYLLSNGVTTVEVKSGYGLSIEDELKMLRVINKANKENSLDIVSTCLAAHMLPKDFDGSSEEYLEFIIQKIVPEIKKEKLTNRFDIFIEKSAFKTEESLKYLRQLKELGFDITVHGDQFTTGGSKVAVELGAKSVDHLEVSGDNEIEMIAKSNTIATALPGASIGLGVSYTPVRKLLDAGACVAIASDWNPGSAPNGNLLTQASILSCYEKISAAEVWSGITFRAAAALGLKNVGVLDKGKKADIQTYPTNDFREILYHQGRMKPNAIWKKGERVY